MNTITKEEWAKLSNCLHSVRRAYNDAKLNEDERLYEMELAVKAAQMEIDAIRARWKQ